MGVGWGGGGGGGGGGGCPSKTINIASHENVRIGTIINE